jgi:DNA-binding GntR family transcriptional regulator
MTKSAALPAPAAPRRFDATLPLALEIVPFLEDLIITRRIAPGTKLVELDLCEQYGISRSPMREAFRLLEASGLLIRRPRFGVRIAPMTLANLDQVYTCRVPLEALAAGAIAGRADRQAAATLLATCLQRMRKAHRKHDIDASFRANAALTDALHRECRNPVLATLLDQINKPALRYRHWAYFEQPALLPLSIESNDLMIAAIQAGDRARAEAVTRKLVRDAWRLVREAFVGSGGERQ